MDREDLLAFASRDWQRLARAKTEHGLSRKRAMTPAAVLAAGDQLRQHARDVRADWPTETDRADDLAVHARVAGALRGILLRPR